MRTIQQTTGGNTVQSEVIVLATGAANGGDTYDARQIRTLTSADVVTAILQGAVFKANNSAPISTELALEVKLASVGNVLLTSALPVNQGLPNTSANRWKTQVTDGISDVVTTTFSGGLQVGLPVYLADQNGIIGLAPGTTTGVSVNNNASNVPWLGTNENSIPAAGGSEPGSILPALANGSKPTKIEGAWVALSTDLSGNLRVANSNIPVLSTDPYGNLNTTNNHFSQAPKLSWGPGWGNFTGW